MKGTKRDGAASGRGKKLGTPARAGAPATELHAPRPALVPQALSRADGVAAAGIGLGALGLYGATACRTIYVGDSPELAMTAAVFGIPHPPGYPLFTIVSGVLVHLLPLERALAANLVAALYAATSVALAFLASRRLGASRPASAFGAISLAAGSTFWAQGTAIEVYGFDVMLGLGALHATLCAVRSPRHTWLAVLAGSLWVGHRPLDVAYAPALVFLASATGLPLRPLLREPRLLVPLVGGALPFAWLSLRSAFDPALDVGDPSSVERFFTVVRSAPYVRHWLAGTLELGVARVGRHLLAMPHELGLAAVLGAAALVLPSVLPRRVAAAFGWTVLVNLAIATGYHVLDIEAYFLPSTVALALVAPLALDRLVARLSAPAVVHVAPLLCALALVPLHFGERDLSGHRLVRAAAEDTLRAADEGALVLVDGDTSIHALWYLQGVEALRPDVLVFSPGHVSGWYLDALRAAHPEEPWPSYAEARLEPAGHTRAVLRALGADRPLHATASVDLARFGAGGGPRDPLGSVPHGLGSRLLPVGSSVEVDAVAAFASAYFADAMDRLLPMPEHVDVDSASLYLEYALSMSRAADLVAHRDAGVAARLYRDVLALRPDACERIVADDVRLGLGQEIPPLELEAHAERALAELEARGGELE